jgi:dihydroorotate dehydrogenase electron transfer subunit
MLTVAKTVDETPTIKTVRFRESLEACPGQFVMVWVPGVDEYPMSLSYLGRNAGITVQVKGDGTRALASAKPGDKIGIRGPYGHGYELVGKRIFVIAGGTGMASIMTFVEQALSRKAKVDVVLGARTSTELLFEKRIARAGAKAYISTDDGTKGFKGFATELAGKIMSEQRYSCVYTCGPEQMISKVVRLAERRATPMQASLERLMKCGIGICDSCAIDGMHVCRDGPVFGKNELNRLDDFGRTKLDLDGRKVPI